MKIDCIDGYYVQIDTSGKQVARVRDLRTLPIYASAPDLLEACKAALEVTTDDVVQGLLNEAIRKASGE